MNLSQPNASSASARSPSIALDALQLREEHLPFTVRVVGTEEDLRKAIYIRHAAYSRHVPEFAASLVLPEEADRNPGSVVLLAESKVDGSPLGTMRIQTNQFAPLRLEESVPLPSWLAGLRLAEATRLGVTEDRAGRLVKTVLFKAFYLYCLHNGIDWMVITARAPLDRMYERLLFNDVHPGMGYVPIKHVGGMPHRVMCFDVAEAERNWRKAGHPLAGFMFDTLHPDLNVSARNGETSQAPAKARLGGTELVFS